MKQVYLFLLLSILSSCSYLDSFRIFDSTNNTKQFDSINVERLWSEDIGKDRSFKTGVLQPHFLDGVVYTIDSDGLISSVDQKNGNTLWSYDLNKEVSSGLSVHNNIVYFGTNDGKFYGFDLQKISSSSGIFETIDIFGFFQQEKVEPYLVMQLTSTVSSVALAIDQLLFIKLDDGDTVAINSISKDIEWIYKGRNVPLSIKGSGSIAHSNNKIFVARDDGNLVSLNTDTGKLNWLISISARSGRNELESLRDVEMTPFVQDGIVYAASYQGNLVAVDILTGNLVWSMPMSVLSNIDVDMKNVYVSDTNGNIFAIDKYTGDVAWKTVLWKSKVREKYSATQTHVFQEYIVSLSTDGHIIIIDKISGELLTFKEVISDIEPQSEGVLLDKILYIITKNGRLNAIKIN